MNFIPIANTFIGDEEAKAVHDVVSSGWISMGKKVVEFENMVAEYTNSEWAVAMNNGTSTLHALLLALEIGPGDEVILPSLTYISTANVVLYVGATPVLCESDEDTFNVSPEHVRSKITNKTKAIITVDLKGMPVDFDAFNQLSEETGISIISDSAESLGSKYKKKPVGSQLLAHSFSFFANKNITTGEGGMITTNDKDLYEKLIIIRNQGQEGRYNHTHLGNNFRLTDIQASFGIEQFRRVDWLMSEKEKIANYYTNKLAPIAGIQTPFVPSYVSRSSWYMYSIKLHSSKRDNLLRYLEEQGIDTRLSFPPVHIQPYYQKKFGFKNTDFPIAYKTYLEFVDIPIWVGMDSNKMDYVISTIYKFINL